MGASVRMPNCNYDFIIANYGYSWVLDLLIPEEQLRQLDYSHMIRSTAGILDGVSEDMVPEVAKESLVREVANFVNINSKTAITIAEKDAQMNYFREQSQEALARICHTIKDVGK